MTAALLLLCLVPPQAPTAIIPARIGKLKVFGNVEVIAEEGASPAKGFKFSAMAYVLPRMPQRVAFKSAKIWIEGPRGEKVTVPLNLTNPQSDDIVSGHIAADRAKWPTGLCHWRGYVRLQLTQREVTTLVTLPANFPVFLSPPPASAAELSRGQELARFRSKYLGRTVYFRAGTRDVGGNPFELGVPYRVAAIDRPATGYRQIALRNAQMDDGSHLITVADPYQVILRRADRSTGRSSAQFAGLWHFERCASLQRPPKWIVQESRNPGLQSHPIKGQTRAEIAWSSGFPGDEASASELNRWEQWDYQEPPPFNWAVWFKHDRVVRYDEPGTPP